MWNRGKESVVADLRTDAGRGESASSPTRADVVIEGFGAGVADGWGLGDEHLRAANPGLVYCSVKGFGSTGAVRHDPGVRGHRGRQGRRLQPGTFGFRSGPIFVNALLGSVGAGHMACSGVLAALVARETHRPGPARRGHDAAGLQPARLLRHHDLAAHAAHHRRRATARRPSGALMGASRYSFFVPTQDGRWVIFTQMLPHQAHALSRAAGMEHTIDDPRFDKQPQFATAEDAQAWEDLLWEAMAEHPYEYWEKVFLADPDIAFELARFSEEGLDHQQIRHNGEAITVDDPGAGPVEQIGPIARFADTPSRIDRSAPAARRARGRPRRAAAAHRDRRPGAAAPARRHHRSSSSATSTPCPTGSRWPARSAPG